MQAEPMFRSRRISVLLAAAVVIALAGGLAVRLAAREVTATAPEAAVHAPTAADLSTLEVPCWSCPTARKWPLRFRTDLDLLAPLGDGPGNAADFFVQFRKSGGSREAEAAAFLARRQTIEGLEDYGSVVAYDDPLLLEAEPWVDQARMRYYPDVLPVSFYTALPNLLMMLSMARTWTARGVSAEDPRTGLADCRRAIRLGRLLRQEDAVLINDLAGLACIHIGTRGVYDIARRIGDKELALVASIVLGEVAPQRLYTAQRMTAAVNLKPYLHPAAGGGLALDLPAARFDAAVDMIEGSPDRRLRAEAVLQGYVVVHLATPEQRERMRAVLDEIATGGDPVLAKLAEWARDTPLSDELLSWFADNRMEQ